jgi:oxygen-dependent protoporphyrinogen oxidase
MARFVIVGGGISGLSLAYRLQQLQPTADVVVLERQPRVGGCVETVVRDGFRVEAGPNGFLDTKPAMLDLCRDLGISDRLVAASAAAARNRYLLLGGRLRLLPSSLGSFLASDILSWPAKLALLLERLRPPRRAGRDESIDTFACRHAGREVADTLADPFVTGIYAGDPKKLSIQACFPRLVAFERDHGSVLGGMAHSRRAAAAAEPAKARGRQQLWSFREGLGLLIQALREKLRRPPLEGVRAVAVRRHPHAGQPWSVHTAGGDNWVADAVALACPAYEQAAILEGLSPPLAADIGGIAYNRIAVVAVGYPAAEVPHGLDGFGYLSPQRLHRDVLGMQWCSSTWPERAPPGMVLLRALCGGWGRPDIVEWDDARLAGAVQTEAIRTLGIRAAPCFLRIVRWDRAIPQYFVGHLDRVARIAAAAAQFPGLFLGGNAYRGVSLADCVEQAGKLAERMVQAVQPS